MSLIRFQKSCLRKLMPLITDIWDQHISNMPISKSVLLRGIFLNKFTACYLNMKINNVFSPNFISIFNDFFHYFTEPMNDLNWWWHLKRDNINKITKTDNLTSGFITTIVWYNCATGWKILLPGKGEMFKVNKGSSTTTKWICDDKVDFHSH